jgi:hypothetical protein
VGKEYTGTNLVTSPYTTRTKLYRLLQSYVCAIQDIVGGALVRAHEVHHILGLSTALAMTEAAYLEARRRRDM